MHREFPLFFVPKSAHNEGAVFAIKRAMQQEPRLKITLQNLADDGLIDGVF
jgi:urocanate hydratase